MQGLKTKQSPISSPYDHLLEFYDKLNTYDDKFYRFIQKKISKYSPNTKTILEIACGTGSVIGRFPKKYNLTGFDLSKKMVALAKKKHKGIDFLILNMRDFRFNKNFDVTFCVYDSINHLLTINDWKKTFACTSKALNKKGIFIFDVNTQFKMKSFKDVPAQHYKNKKNECNIKILSNRHDEATWDITIRSTKNLIRNDSFLIREKTFPLNIISKSLSKHFDILEIVDFEEKPTTKMTKRAFFVCQKKD